MKCDNCGHDNVDGARFCATCGNTLMVGDVAEQKSLIGEVVGGRYRIVGLIGEGGMGVVYKAEQKLGSAIRPVAVKTLHAELSRDPAVTARFHREVGTVAQLEHPNTVKVYDFGSTDDGTLYIAMEFLDGHALAKIITTEGALPLERVSKIVHQIAGSLEEAHRGGIIHRDLKPENVLLVGRAGERDVVKLVDFGIAARTESADRAKEQKLTQQGTVLGTPPYMSPEQFTGKALDARSDIYSLGVMVYEMLTGELPFEANTAWEWATAHMTAQPRDFTATRAGDAVPKPVRDVVLKAMSKDPAQRQASASEFDRQLAEAINRARTAPAVAVDVAAATQAMPQAPSELAVAATAAMPMPTPGSPSPVALPPAPPRERPQGGSKTPIIALGGLGAVLLIAMGVVALQSGGDDTPPDPTALGTSPSEPPPTVVTAEVPKQSVSGSETATPEPTPAPAAPEEPEPKPQPAPKPKPTATTPPKPATTPAPAPQPTPKPPPATTPAPPVTTPPPAAPPPAPPAPPASNACAQCSNAVAASDWDAAAQHYANCSNKQEKSSCTSRMATAAPRAARTAALNQNCAKARSIAAAAQQMGVPAGRFAQPLSPCK